MDLKKSQALFLVQSKKVDIIAKKLQNKIIFLWSFDLNFIKFYC